jgi:hypothetical protein
MTALFALVALTNNISIAAEEAKKENEKTTKSEAASNPQTSKPNVEVINLTVYPAPLPRPVLKYRLLPTYFEMTPGNAATLYRRSFRSLNDRFKDRTDKITLEKINDSSDRPLNELLKDEKMVNFLNNFDLDEIEYASRRTDCDWGFPVREYENPFAMILDEVQDCRDYLRIIQLKARLQIAQGNPQKALNTLKLGYAMSRHVAHAPFLVSCLVGNAIAGVMNSELETLIQTKDAPNLYWTLTVVPHPFIDFNQAIDYESVCVLMQFKELQEARTGEHSPEQWQKLWTRFIGNFNAYSRLMFTSPGEEPMKLNADQVLKDKYAFVCEQLKSRRWSENEIKEKAPGRLMLLYCAELYDELRDEELKWVGVLVSQLPNDFIGQEKKRFERDKEIEVVPLSKVITPFYRALTSQARIEQYFAALRGIEALRLYASNHDGKLPTSLEEIKEVPVPIDPWTNKAISYHLVGETAVISIKRPIPTGEWTTEYRIKIAK